MKIFAPDDSFIKPFEGEITKCRHINDDLILFGRGGEIIGSRTGNSLLGAGDNLYDLMSPAEARNIADLCVSFNYKRLVVDTELGGAVVYNDMCGACGLLAAVFPLVEKEAVFEYFARLGGGSQFLSESAKALSGGKFKEGALNLVSDVCNRADEVFLTANIAMTKYLLGANIVTGLCDYILRAADYIGCVGKVKCSLEVLPKFENFSPEMFAAMTACVILFARDRGKARSFMAKIVEYNSHPMVTFCIEVDSDFELFINHGYRYPELMFCERAADLRKTVFDCYLRDDANPRVMIAYIPETDPLDGRIIKEPIEEYVRRFWEE